ncbi:MAG: exodeoxyribonuclease III [Chromatiales bacterium]|nr:exodeoxyribonuclease III [Chromatiales bacterium]
MRIASWNVNSLKVRLPQVLSWCETAAPDVLALQETKLTDENFPLLDIEAAGYRAAYSGQKTYNGVALLARAPLSDIVTDIPGLDDPQRRILAATVGDDLRVINLYVVNGQAVGTEKYHYKLQWLEQVRAFVANQLQAFPRLVVLGDFNIAPEDRDVHDPVAWNGQILCSDMERQAFRALLALGLKDSFRLFEQPQDSFSWWDYRAAGFRRNRGLRIDHILLSEPMVRSCTRSWIDRDPRGWERPSDHAPVLVDLA